MERADDFPNSITSFDNSSRAPRLGGRRAAKATGVLLVNGRIRRDGRATNSRRSVRQNRPNRESLATANQFRARPAAGRPGIGQAHGRRTFLHLIRNGCGQPGDPRALARNREFLPKSLRWPRLAISRRAVAGNHRNRNGFDRAARSAIGPLRPAVNCETASVKTELTRCSGPNDRVGNRGRRGEGRSLPSGPNAGSFRWRKWP